MIDTQCIVNRRNGGGVMEYKGYDIDTTTYKYITVQYNGDDVVFDTIEEAKQFIDEITEV